MADEAVPNQTNIETQILETQILFEIGKLCDGQCFFDFSEQHHQCLKHECWSDLSSNQSLQSPS